MAADYDSETPPRSRAGDSALRFIEIDTRGSEREVASATAEKSDVGSVASLSLWNRCSGGYLGSIYTGYC